MSASFQGWTQHGKEVMKTNRFQPMFPFVDLESSYSSLIVFSNFTTGRNLCRKGNEPTMFQCILLWFLFYSNSATPSSVFSFIHLHNPDRPHKYFTKSPHISNQSSSPWLSQTEEASLHIRGSRSRKQKQEMAFRRGHFRCLMLRSKEGGRFQKARDFVSFTTLNPTCPIGH